MEETARPGAIDQKVCFPQSRLFPIFSMKANHATSFFHSMQPDALKTGGDLTLCFAEKKMIQVPAIPMRVGNAIMRTRRNQQLIVMVEPWPEFNAELVVIKSETAFQSASDLGITFPPRSPFRERSQPWQIIFF